MALFMGALMIHGIQPGPLFIKNYPQIFWGVVASMYIGNAMLLALNLPLIGIWVRFLRIPYVILFPLILLFCLIGVYTLENNVGDIYIMLVFGILGFLARKAGFEGAPFLLALVLGPIMERSLRQSLLMSHGSLSIFFNRSISALLICLGLAILITPFIPGLKKRKKQLSEEVGEG
jgi:putative tricarboxylic transport membrane protein